MMCLSWLSWKTTLSYHGRHGKYHDHSSIKNYNFCCKKHGKYDDHTMIIVRIMENTEITPRPRHESWRPWQEAKKHGHHTVIMA